MWCPDAADRPDDESSDAQDRSYPLKRKYREWLDTYDRKKLTPSQRYTLIIL
jgi:hypothetical protein